MPTEQIRKRVQNRGTVLRALHFHGPLRRSELSRRFGIRKSSITNIIKELSDARLVRESAAGAVRSPLMLNESVHSALAVSIHPDHVAFGQVFLDGRLEILGRQKLAANDPDSVVSVLERELRRYIQDAAVPFLGLGMAVPGTVNPATGTVLSSANLHGWRGVSLADRLSSLLPGPVVVENDIRCQLWNCAWFERRLNETRNLLYLGLGNGVACSIIAHGERVSGARSAAGEIGHTRWGEEGRTCNCGRTDCLETYCSISAIMREIATVMPQDTGVLDLETIISLAADSPVVPNVLDRVAARLARPLAAVIAAFDPQEFFLGTPSRTFSEILLVPLQRHLEGELTGIAAPSIRVQAADAAGKTSLRGAAGLVLEKMFVQHTLLTEGA